MLAEFEFEDIIFGIFPKASGTMGEAYDSWPNNSVGDVIDMLMQALEVSLTFSRAALRCFSTITGPRIYS